MITLSKSGNTVTFTFDENSGYLQNGTIDVPVNSLSLILDESDMATFRKSASNDIFVSARYEEFGMSKAELEAWYKENMVGSTGGGGDITSGEVQTMIDESISGKADTSAVTQSINAAVSGKIDSESAVTNVKVLTVSQQNEVQIAQSKGDSTASTFVGTVYRVGSGLTWNYQTKEFAVDSSTVALKSEVDAALSGKQDTLIEGRAIDITNNTVSLDLPISAGTGTYSIREGYNTIASGNSSHAEGRQTQAYGYTSHAEGESTSATSDSSHAEGYETLASGYYSHAEGQSTKADGNYSHAEGFNTTASGIYSHAEGRYTSALTESSHAEGQYTKTANKYEHASGRFNLSTSATTTFGDSGNTLFSVGNGTGSDARHNAFEIRQNGDIYLTSGGTDILLQDHLGGGGKAIEAGRGISITTGETADTINCTLPIYFNSNETKGDIAIGTNLTGASSDYKNLLIGRRIEIGNEGSLASNNIGIGFNTSSSSTAKNTIYGASNVALGDNFEIGTSSNNRNSGCVVIGNNAKSKINNGVAIGYNTVASGTTITNINNQITVDTSNQVYIYNKDNTEMICLQDQLGGGEVSSAITSGDTNAVAGGAVYDKFDEVESVTAAALNVLNDKFDGLTLKKLTQAQYDALSPNYDNNTLYVII